MDRAAQWRLLYIDDDAKACSQVKELLGHFSKDSALLNIPLEGDVAYKGNGGWIYFAFQPDDYQLQAIFKGTITNGELPIED